MTQKEWLDETHRIADNLERQANKECEEEIEKARAYCQGYIQGVEDYARAIRANIAKNKNWE